MRYLYRQAKTGEPLPPDHWYLRIKRWKHKGTAAYCLLAVATAFSFQQQAQHSADARRDITKATEQVLYAGCVRGNDLRRTLRGIVRQSQPQVRSFVKAGTLTPAQGREQLALIKRELLVLGDVRCSFVNRIG